MKKRVISFMLVINSLFLLTFGRLYCLMDKSTEATASYGTRITELSLKRGFIYDRRLTPLVNDSYSYSLCIKPTPEAIKFIKAKSPNGKILNSLYKGKFTVIDTNQEIKSNSDSFKVIKKFNRYKDDSLCHIIGYNDLSLNGVYGIEKYFNNELTNFGGKLSVVYSTDALGGMLLGEKVEIRSENYYSHSGIVLTIDKNIQAIVENALKRSTIDKGAVVVMDVESGEILGCASVPCFDRNNLASSINNKASPFLNRAFSQFPVGSIFKIVTTAAALENNIKLNNFYCNGSITKSGNTFRCSKLEGHKEISLYDALSKSCNPYFIELGVKVGGEKLLKKSEELGFGKAIDFGNGYFTDKGTLPTIEELNSEAAIGNFAFGQGKLTATPIQIASLMATIGNKGYYKEPTLIKGTFTDSDGLKENENIKERQVLKENTCKEIIKALELTSKTGTGKAAFSSLINIASKTSTAQSGVLNSDGSELKYCWFTGIFPIESPKYSICIIKENGSSGGLDGGPVFKEISENIYIYDKLNYSKSKTF